MLVAKNVSSCEPADLAERLEALIGREYISEDYVRCRIELLKAQTAVYDALARAACSPATGAADAEEGPETAAVDPSDIPLDRALLARLFEDLSAAFQKNDRRSDDLARLATAIAKNSDLLEQLAGKAAFGSNKGFLASLSARLAVSVEALLFFGRVLGAPFVADAVRRLKQRAPAARKTSGCCPWCGSPPGLASLKREGGQRVLFCSVCGESWEFSRVECPFCGDQAGLGTLTVGTDDPCSIETCGQCKGYLKTVDEGQLPRDEEVVPLVETTATVYLDLIAEKEGYARALPYVAIQ